METYLLAALMLTFVGTAWTQQTFLPTFVVFNPGFGDISKPEIKANITAECVQACSETSGGIAECVFAHPYACNVFVRCIRFWHLMYIYGERTSDGTLFDSDTKDQKSAFTNKVANEHVCKRAPHPCVSGRPMPWQGTLCGGFILCEGTDFTYNDCPEGSGFSAWSGECDLVCDKSKRSIVDTQCGPSNKGDDFFYINETVIYGDTNVPVIEPTESGCASNTRYLTMGKCACDSVLNEVTEATCATITPLHLSSSDNSWQLAKDQQPVQGSALSGGVQVAGASEMMPRAGFFDGSSWIVATGLHKNDLGLYFNLTFTFLSVKQDLQTPGLDYPAGQNGPILVALTGNGIDGKEASYDCHLKVERSDAGRVECFIKPSTASDAKPSGDVVIITPEELDLRRKISVVLSKDDGAVRLVVRAEGGSEEVVNKRIRRGNRAFGNDASLAIGKADAAVDFLGYIDDMFLKKFCGPFLM